MRKFAAPRYRTCWWCNRQIRANFHRAMRSTHDPDDFDPVIVHASCAADMEREGGFEVAHDPTRVPALNAESAA